MSGGSGISAAAIRACSSSAVEVRAAWSASSASVDRVNVMCDTAPANIHTVSPQSWSTASKEFAGMMQHTAHWWCNVKAHQRSMCTTRCRARGIVRLL